MGQETLSTLGEQLAKTNPGLVDKISKIRTSDQAVGRLCSILSDLFPYSWGNSDAFENGIKFCARGQNKEALKQFRIAIELNPDAYPAYHLMGYVYGNLGKTKEELENYKRTVKYVSNRPQIFIDLGRGHWRKGQLKKALAAYKEAVLLDPDFSIINHWLTLSFDRLGRYPDNLSEDDPISREKDRSMAQAYSMLGDAYIEFGLHPSARKAFKEAVRIQPDYADGFFKLGIMHVKKLRNPKRAAKYLKQAEDLYIKQDDLHSASLAVQLLKPDDKGIDKEKAAEEWLKEGLRLQNIGYFQGASDAYREAIHHKPNYLDAYYNMGIAYGSLQDAGINKINSAIGAFKEAIRINPKFHHAHIALGASYIKQNEFEEALEILIRASDINPENPQIHYYLGIAYRMSSRFSDAAHSFKMAVQLNPSSAEWHYYLALVYFDMMHYQDSCHSLQETIRLKPDFAEGHYMLGIIYSENIPDEEKSIAHLKKAEKLYTKLEDYIHAARARQMLDKYSV
jgi:tetratricopeptide (TPR) repeat protein